MAMGALITGQGASFENGTARPVPLSTAPPAAKSVVGFHGAVTEFKRRLIEATLTQAGGNRTRAAKALGLQRTYLLRLMREFEIRIPPQQMPPCRSEQAPTRLPSQIH
jgi:transcriptional regulator with GAF, ATPase, and Fis domain